MNIIATRTADYLIERAKRTPFTHLYNPDGSLYMERYWLRAENEAQDITTVRVHRIVGPDIDAAMHDHPWGFVSIVLRGGYWERRPISINPCFMRNATNIEQYNETYRRAGSIAYRRATDRHRIVHVDNDTWTLFIAREKIQWWGFYTPQGKIYYKDYESKHLTRGARNA